MYRLVARLRHNKAIGAFVLGFSSPLGTLIDVSRDDTGLLFDEERRTAPPLIEPGHLLRASRAVEANQEAAADLAYLRGRGTSLGGMRPKCTVIDDDRAVGIGRFPIILE